MKKNTILISLFMLGILALAGCKKEEDKIPGNPVIDTQTAINKAYFGDSLTFSVDVSDGQVPLSTLKAQLYYSEEMVSETVIRTRTDGNYQGKIHIPYLQFVPNGTATLKFVLQNINLTITEEVHELPLERPDYPFLMLVTEDQEYRMERTDLYQYALTQELPARMAGYIKAPAYGEQGNELTFGWESNAIREGSSAPIPFSNAFSGNYSINFNSFNYEADPFIVAYAMNETVMERINDELYEVDLQLNQGQEVTIDGFDDLDDWWIDPDFLVRDGDRLLFQPISGNYRIMADFDQQYFVFEALRGNDLATLQPDGSGAIWIIGEGIGKPSVQENEVGWTTEKALCLAPMGNKTYQITVVPGTTIRADNINFKFFHQKNWGGEFTNAGLSGGGESIFIGNGENGRDPGNLGIEEGQTLEAGATYVLTLDLSAGNDQAVLSVTKK